MSAVSMRFRATVEIAGINPYVGVPARIVRALGGGPRVPVLIEVAAVGAGSERGRRSPSEPEPVRDADRLRAVGRLADTGCFRTTIVPERPHGFRLYLDRWMRERAGVGVGDEVGVTLKPDREGRELPVPDLLREALDADARARAAWERLAPSRRREVLAYLNFLKTPAALERNVRRTVEDLVR